jgi:hypothetical protein
MAIKVTIGIKRGINSITSSFISAIRHLRRVESDCQSFTSSLGDYCPYLEPYYVEINAK